MAFFSLPPSNWCDTHARQLQCDSICLMMQPQFKLVKAKAPKAPVVISPTTQVELKFINGVVFDEKDALKARREVRSHVAKVSASQNQSGQKSSQGNRVPRKRRAKALVWPIYLDVATEQDRLTKTPPRSFPNNSSAVPAVDSVVARLPFVPLLLDNYLKNLAVAVPELDGPDKTLLLRKAWWPMVIHYPVIFQVIVLFSASHYVAQTKDMAMGPAIFFIKQLAITGLRNAIINSNGMYGDEIIASAAKMASYEAIYGTEAVYHTHMKGVTEMVKLRGGLETMGLDGFLARLLQFIDTNSAFLLNCQVYFDESSLPKLANQFLPNPSQFTGLS